MNKKIIILGGGLSGVSLGYFFKQHKVEPLIFEKEPRIGGICSSRRKDGFTFDRSGHLLHFRDKANFLLVNSLLGGNLSRLKRSAWVYNFDKLIPYPFQLNLASLPPRISRYCMSEFIKARNNGNGSGEPASFLDWVYKNFGAGIARYFMIPYNLKFWRTPLEDLSSAWADKLVVNPSLEDMVSEPRNLGYHSSFYYPKRGGIDGLIKGFVRGLSKISLNHEASLIDLKKKKIHFLNGRQERYDILFSTIPLPELGKITTEVPAKIRSAFNKLKWVSIYNINLGLNGKIMPDRHWIYFPGKEVNFFRVGFFHNFSDDLAPEGKSASYVEVSYSGKNTIDKTRINAAIRKDLRRVNIINRETDILCEDVNDIRYGYPIYDKNYEKAREDILGFLEDKSVILCGRYGSWRYFSMEDVISESRERVASLPEHAS